MEIASPLNGGAGLAGKSGRNTANVCDANPMETTMNTRAHRVWCFVALSALLVSSAGVIASAQTIPAAQRWDAWLGCWRTSIPIMPGTPASSPPFVCVTPTNQTSAVEVLTVQGSKVLSRDTIDASGAQHSIALQGCTGSKQGRWSADGRRVLLRSEVTCPGNLKRTATGMLAIAWSILLS